MNVTLKKALPAGLVAALLAMVPFADAMAHGRDRDRHYHHHHHHHHDRGRDRHHHHHHYKPPPPPPVHYHYYGSRPAPRPPATIIYHDPYRSYVPSNSFMLNVQIDGRR